MAGAYATKSWESFSGFSPVWNLQQKITGTPLAMEFPTWFSHQKIDFTRVNPFVEHGLIRGIATLSPRFPLFAPFSADHDEQKNTFQKSFPWPKVRIKTKH